MASASSASAPAPTASDIPKYLKDYRGAGYQLTHDGNIVEADKADTLYSSRYPYFIEDVKGQWSRGRRITIMCPQLPVPPLISGVPDKLKPPSSTSEPPAIKVET